MGQATQAQEEVLAGAIVIAVLAIALDLALGRVQAAVTPGPVRSRWAGLFARRPRRVAAASEASALSAGLLFAFAGVRPVGHARGATPRGTQKAGLCR